MVRRYEVGGGRAGQSRAWARGPVWDIGTQQDQWSLGCGCLSAICLPCPLPCASPAWRWPVEELVGTVGLCRVPAPLAVHVPQVGGTAAQPDVSWAGESQDREGAASPWPPKTLESHLAYNRTPTPCSPRCGCLSAPTPWQGSCQHPCRGDGCSPEEWGVSAARACDQGPQTPSMEVPSGLLRTWMWYLIPGSRSRSTTQVLAWTSLCRRGAKLRSNSRLQTPLPIPDTSMYLSQCWGGCPGCVGADS